MFCIGEVFNFYFYGSYIYAVILFYFIYIKLCHFISILLDM